MVPLLPWSAMGGHTAATEGARMATKLEQLMNEAPPLPGEPDMSTLHTKPALSPEASDELQKFVDRYDEATADGELATRTARAGRGVK